MKEGKSAISGQFSQLVLVPTKVVPVPLTRTKVVPVPRQSGTSTNFQNMIGTSTNPSGTCTTASCCHDFGIHALLSSNSHTEGIGTLIND